MLKCKNAQIFFMPSIRISTERRLAHTHRNQRQHEYKAIAF
ncbi:MAG: hypothetical protein FD181_2043 [Prolixibacteraceae bacterium]|nr:MAG: hypothetical protein FD181_2043 [Prolixibacteraceae bacterium]